MKFKFLIVINKYLDTFNKKMQKELVSLKANVEKLSQGDEMQKELSSLKSYVGKLAQGVGAHAGKNECLKGKSWKKQSCEKCFKDGSTIG